MREFNTGATRDSDEGKIDYEGFLSPEVLEVYGKYMNKHRIQADGKVRDSDNWMKGFGDNHCEVCIKSLWRHFMDMWFIHRGYKRTDNKDGHEVTLIEACSAMLFNIMAYMYIYLKEQKKEQVFQCPENKSICNLGYACDACPYNKDLKEKD